MLSEKQLEDLKYLRSLDRIIIPSEFTYWCHSTMYKPASDCVTLSDKRCWNEIPTDNFTIKRVAVIQMKLSDEDYMKRVQLYGITLKMVLTLILKMKILVVMKVVYVYQRLLLKKVFLQM